MSYKWCVVPQCTNTSIKTPEKVFVSIPKNTKIREKWLKLAHRNPKDIAASTNAFMCEDHFNMEQDIANYRQYKMKFSKNIVMVEGAMPSKFHCQEAQRKRMSDTTMSQTAYIKGLKSNVQSYEIETQATTDTSEPSTSNNVVLQTVVETKELLQKYCEKGTLTEPIVCVEKQVQTSFKVPYRTKAVQTKPTTRDISLSPYKVPTKSSITSPFKITECHQRPTSGDTKIKKKIDFPREEGSDSHISSFMEIVVSQNSESKKVQ